MATVILKIGSGHAVFRHTSTLINVRDYGAVGNGVTDDAASIQAALDAVPPLGGTVFVPSGDYRISASLVISKDGTTLTGEGATSVIRLMDGVQVVGVIMPNGYGGNLDPALTVTNVTVSRLTLDGNHNNPIDYSDPNHGPDYFGIFIRQATHVTLSKLIVRNWGSDGISASNGNTPIDYLTIEDCLVSGCHRNGIHIGFATNCVIRRNHVGDTPSQYWGPSSANAIDVEIEGYDYYGPAPHYPFVRTCLIENNILERTSSATSGDGIGLQPAYGPLSGMTIQNNLICGHQRAVQATSAAGGFNYGEVAGVHDVTVQSNWMSVDSGFSVSGFAVDLVACASVSVIGNVVNDVVNGNWSTGAAVQIGAAHLTNVQNNLIRFSVSGTNGVVYLYNATDSTDVSGNSYQTAGDTVIRTDSSDTNTTSSNNTPLSTGSWDRTAPTTSIGVSPGTTFTVPTDITVTASDADSGVARVYFFIDGVPCGYSDTAPHIFNVDPTGHSHGTHTLSALAVDNEAVFDVNTLSTVSVIF